MCWKVRRNVTSSYATEREREKRTGISWFLSKFYVFCLPSKLWSICNRRKKAKNEINIRHGICRDTAKTVHYIFFVNAWNVYAYIRKCLFIFSIQYFLQIELHFSAYFLSLIFFSSLCCLLFRAHVHKWSLLTLYWFTAECAAEVEE